MLGTRVIPCLLLKDESLVKTVRFKHPNYVGDPINAVRIYNQKEVDELIFLDIGATVHQRKPSFDLLSVLASECFMPFAYGGGIRQIQDIRQIFSLGVEKVAINTYAVENPAFVREAADTFGSQSVIVSIDVKQDIFGKYRVTTHGGRKKTNLDPIRFAAYMEEMGAGELLLNSVNRDGTWQGYDIDLIKGVTSAVTLPVIVSGGAGKLQDFADAVQNGGASAVAAGSMVVYQGKDLGVLIRFPAREDLQKVFVRS